MRSLLKSITVVLGLFTASLLPGAALGAGCLLAPSTLQKLSSIPSAKISIVSKKLAPFYLEAAYGFTGNQYPGISEHVVVIEFKQAGGSVLVLPISNNKICVMLRITPKEHAASVGYAFGKLAEPSI